MARHTAGRTYRVIAISLYEDDAAAADRLSAILRSGGWPKANRSLILREALIRLEEDLVGVSVQEVFHYFANRLAKRAAEPSATHAARHAAYGGSRSVEAEPPIAAPDNKIRQ